MKTFLIQITDNMITHDFSFALIEAIKYNNWYYGEKTYNYILQEDTKLPLDNDDKPYKDDLESIIPVGSVEFVLKYLNDYYGIKNVKPINIPDELNKYKYTKRNIWSNFETSPKNISEIVFYKSKNIIKGMSGITKNTKVPTYPGYEFLISDFIDIKSEWRVFVWRNTLFGLQNYSGDYTIFPDVKLIKEMIVDYNNETAYTLDVGINDKDGTFIVECHDFFSCGLYGFADYRILPNMFIDTWNKLVKGENQII